MEPAVRALYTQEVMALVAKAVGVAPTGLRTLDGFRSFVHEATVEGTPRIVRATWHERRSRQEIGAELHFIRALAEGGLPVCRPLPLPNGAYIDSVPASAGSFNVCLFEKAPGAVLPREQWTDETLEIWGALAGQMHRVGTAYEGPPTPLSRPSWEQEHASIARILEGDAFFHSRFQDLLTEIGHLPRTPGSFGPMHTDLHRHNIFWHQGRPRVFDFDDMLEFWFVSDLAIILYYAAMNPIWPENDRQGDYDRAKTALLGGYATQHRLPDGCLETLPLFLSLREQTLRAVILRSMAPDERSAPWRRYLEEATHRIRRGEAALGLEP